MPLAILANSVWEMVDPASMTPWIPGSVAADAG